MSLSSPLTLVTVQPQVTLRNAPVDAFDGAIAAARTCYSPRVITAAILIDQIDDSIPGRKPNPILIYQHSLFKSKVGMGHGTTKKRQNIFGCNLHTATLYDFS